MRLSQGMAGLRLLSRKLAVSSDGSVPRLYPLDALLAASPDPWYTRADLTRGSPGYLMGAHAVGEVGRRRESQFFHGYPMYELFTLCGGESWR